MSIASNVAPPKILRPKPEPWTCPTHGLVAKHWGQCPSGDGDARCPSKRPS